MKYYAIVNRIKDEHKSGIYGRKMLNASEIKELNKQFAKDLVIDVALYTIPIIGIPAILSRKLFRADNKKNSSNKIVFQKAIKTENKAIIIPNAGLENDYSLDDEFSYGLLDELTFKDKSFEILMKSKGGSTLHILERDDLPEGLCHFSGELGRFSEGIYIAHPKDDSLLIPLNNSNSLIQSLILEETIRAYEALGAKSIKIHDLTSTKGGVGGKKGMFEAKAKVGYQHEILREKTFGKGTFDPERAKKDKLLIYDIPAIRSTIEARIDGNQITEKFTEDVNLSIGLDVNVLELFKANSNFSYQRKWSFDVEFYDKSELA